MKATLDHQRKSSRARAWLGSLSRCLWLALLILATTYVVLFYLGLLVPGITSITLVRLGGWPMLIALVGVPIVLWIQTHRWAWDIPKTVRSYLWFSVLLASLVALFYSIERYRGRNQWQQLQQRVDTPDNLSVLSLRPDPVPAQDDFAQASAVKHWMDTDRTPPAWIGTSAHMFLQRQVGAAWEWQRQTNVNLRSVLAAELAENAIRLDESALSGPEAVLRGLEPYETLFEQIREASTRPYARFELPYAEGYVGLVRDRTVLPLMDLAGLLRLRSCALLRLDRSDEAWEDLQLIFRLADYTAQSPVLYHETLRLLSQVIQPLWEGLADHRWSRAQLESAEEALARRAPLPRLPAALNAEALLHMDLVESMFPAHSKERSVFGPEDWLGRRLLDTARWLYPTGWSLQDQVGVFNAFGSVVEDAIDLGALTVRPAETANIGGDLIHHPPSLDPLTVTFLLPRWVQMVEYLPMEFAYLHGVYQQAMLACALERYRLANDNYPDQLESLSPSHVETIPTDVIEGGSLHYRRVAEGGFLLYSVGWNQVDDRGATSLRSRDGIDPRPSYSFGFIEPDRGDWVWRSQKNSSQRRWTSEPTDDTMAP